MHSIDDKTLLDEPTIPDDCADVEAEWIEAARPTTHDEPTWPSSLEQGVGATIGRPWQLPFARGLRW